jgi:hypothetical protein
MGAALQLLLRGAVAATCNVQGPFPFLYNYGPVVWYTHLSAYIYMYAQMIYFMQVGAEAPSSPAREKGEQIADRLLDQEGGEKEGERGGGLTRPSLASQ